MNATIQRHVENPTLTCRRFLKAAPMDKSYTFSSLFPIVYQTLSHQLIEKVSQVYTINLAFKATLSPKHLDRRPSVGLIHIRLVETVTLNEHQRSTHRQSDARMYI